MKLRIGYYDVEIKAKHRYNKRTSKEDTMYFLSNLCNVYREASSWNKKRGYDSTAFTYSENARQIYRLLEKEGLFDK